MTYEKTVKIKPLWYEKKRITTLEGLLALLKKSDPPLFVKGLDTVERRNALMQRCDKHLIRIRIGRSMETDLIKHKTSYIVRHSVELLAVYEFTNDVVCKKCKCLLHHNLITDATECSYCGSLDSVDLTPTKYL